MGSTFSGGATLGPMLRLMAGPLAAGMLLSALGCGPRTAVTTWRYATWYPRNGSGSEVAFLVQRRRCLEETGIVDAAGVEADSPEEDRFIACMNEGNWCTVSFDCHKPEAGP